MNDWQPAASREALRQRARMLAGIRAFFAQANVLEVATPMLSHAATTDVQIDSFTVTSGAQPRYLHTSPEFPMKRLLAAGSGDIYQICQVFRVDEAGRLHNPEFSLLEWYRVGWDTGQLIEEVVSLIQTAADALGRRAPIHVRRMSYAQAFHEALALDAHAATVQQLCAAGEHFGLGVVGRLDRDGWLDVLLSECVAAGFPADSLTVIDAYPASQAALARIRPGTPPVAERFEVFVGPVELANGFHELADAHEQAARFTRDNRRRGELGRAQMPADERLLAALAAGFPDCAGVALGLDRLLMWLGGWERIDQVLAFPWARA
ncbi:EF-P lysine aminoacylase EpmA [Acidihalobacter ferrooxydans]|uniref:EF-P lysine aminoacylase GenX n=1 Tax=Acidihalobacter ferrooxydans TaxID=1765967 RepID=A0A1P8UEW0_9GAMM|nr:EF-P lysine aminoacylase EpmA [Acidihalobacter ferrooxydans]APZ42393.1 EF-P lysine aminoacylase GenX [Acidihalobacter ferrooxydans]